MKRVGGAMVLISIIVPLLFYFLMTTNPSELDSWYDDASDGDGTLVLARIESEEHPAEDYYYYEIKGSDTQLYSNKDVADEGDYVLINVEKNGDGIVIESMYSVYMFAFPIAIFLIIGIILYIAGSRAEKHAAEEMPLDPLMRFCTTCGFIMKYVENYDRWYCYQCDKYEAKVYEAEPFMVDALILEKVRCPNCGAISEMEAGPGDLIECASCGTRGRIP